MLERRSLRDYYIIVRERLWVALPVALLLALSFGYYKAQEIPMYSATATMLFERPRNVWSSASRSSTRPYRGRTST